MMDHPTAKDICEIQNKARELELTRQEEQKRKSELQLMQKSSEEYQKIKNFVDSGKLGNFVQKQPMNDSYLWANATSYEKDLGNSPCGVYSQLATRFKEYNGIKISYQQYPYPPGLVAKSACDVKLTWK